MVPQVLRMFEWGSVGEYRRCNRLRAGCPDLSEDMMNSGVWSAGGANVCRVNSSTTHVNMPSTEFSSTMNAGFTPAFAAGASTKCGQDARGTRWQKRSNPNVELGAHALECLRWSGCVAAGATLAAAGCCSICLKSSEANSGFAALPSYAGCAVPGRTACWPATRRLAALICKDRILRTPGEPCSLWFPKPECQPALRACSMAGRIVSLSALPTIGSG